MSEKQRNIQVSFLCLAYTAGVAVHQNNNADSVYPD